jgi:alpha-amylase
LEQEFSKFRPTVYFSRTFSKEEYIDKVVVALDFKIGAKEISVETIFANGTLLTDAYSERSTSCNGKVSIDSEILFYWNRK